MAPYEYIGANGEVTGCDIDLGQAIADALGVELKIVNASFDTLSTYVSNGEADMVIAAMTITDGSGSDHGFQLIRTPLHSSTSSFQKVMIP